MKTIKNISLLFLIVISLSANAQIKILSSGTVNIGDNNRANNGILVAEYSGFMGSGFTMYPNNNNLVTLGKYNAGFNAVYSYNFINLSDARVKENIKEITNALSIVKQLKGVQFDYKADAFDKSFSQNKAYSDKRRKNYLGFLANDVAKVLPQVCFHDDSDSAGLYSMDYTKLIPLLVSAINEQEIIIEQLTAKVNGKGNTKSAQVTSTTVTEINSTVVATLDQNAPNPFSQSTVIGYYLPTTVKSASLNIYDMNGVQIKTIPIISLGKGSITINGFELRPAIYLYTLIYDGQATDTKRMILTQ